MTQQLFGIFPLFPLPEGIIHAHPDLLIVHMILALCGLIILMYATYLVVQLLVLKRWMTISKRKVSEEIIGIKFSFLWAFGFIFLGIYIFFALPFALAILKYKDVRTS